MIYKCTAYFAQKPSNVASQNSLYRKFSGGYISFWNGIFYCWLFHKKKKRLQFFLNKLSLHNTKPYNNEKDNSCIRWI
jgi:hypothetical protein